MLAEKLRAATSAALPIEYVGGYTLGFSGTINDTTITFGGNLTGGLASSASAGDLVVVYFGTGSTSDRNLLIRGYTEVVELYSNDTIDTNLKVAYKFMEATPDTNFVLDDGTQDAGDAGAVAVQVWRNVDKTMPLDVLTTTATGINSVLCNPPAITPITAGAYIVAGGAGGNDAGAQTFSSSNLTGFISSGGNDTRDVTIGLGYKEWTSGAFDPAAFTFSDQDSTSFSWAGVTLALRPTQNKTGPFAISQASAAASAATSLTINKPTATREGDIMVAMMTAGGVASWTGATDWVEIADQTSAAPSLRVAYKVAGPSEGASYTFTASASLLLRGTITTYRNGAYDAIGSLSTSTTASSSFTVSAVTASVDYARIYAAVAQNRASVTIVAPTVMQQIATAAGASAPSYIAAQDAALSFSGSSGTRTFTGFGLNSDAKAGVLTSIKSAAAYTKYANYIAVQSSSTDASATVTVSTPACVPGNLLLFVVTTAINTATDVTVTTPLGWTLLSGSSTGGTAFQPGMYVFYRVVNGSEASSYTAVASTTCTLAASIVTLAGVDVSTLTAGATRTGSSTTNIIANGVTATANGILLYFGAQANNNQGPVTFTPPSGMTEAADTPTDGASTDLSLEVAYQEGLSAGATGTKTATASSQAGTDRFRALLVTVSAL